MRAALLAAICFYQRHLSPLKGFGCAYRVHTGRASCSALGYRAVRRHGVFTGLGLIRERTRRCGAIHRRHHAVAALHSQRGVCDVGCDLPSCDLPDCDLGCDRPGGNLLNCCDCGGCDWPTKKKRADSDRELR
ncbi:membrane protein insertion efficiency factor YidD [Sphaerotilaceae bacterium SBD11-9]